MTQPTHLSIPSCFTDPCLVCEGGWGQVSSAGIITCHTTCALRRAFDRFGFIPERPLYPERGDVERLLALCNDALTSGDRREALRRKLEEARGELERRMAHLGQLLKQVDHALAQVDTEETQEP